MSHVANLRAAQRAAPSPQKRRKLSTGQPSSNGLNGLLNGSSKIHAATTQDVRHSKASAPDLSQVRVGSSRQDPLVIDETDEEDGRAGDRASSADEDDSSADEADADPAHHLALTNGVGEHTDGEGESEDEEMASDGDQSPKPPLQQAQPAGGQLSFGDLLRERGQEPVSVDLTQEAAAAKLAAAPAPNRALVRPQANSLGTVLTQALRTNDVDLLESCLQVSNLESIRATIERLPPSHAASLLQKLAERMHKRPGRAGSLMVWIQWTVVAHGGYLASQPHAMKELHTLHEVVKQRASGLQPLLALKGKLDMLEAQMQLRRNVQRRSRSHHDEAVVYVEGQESSENDDDEEGDDDDVDMDEELDESDAEELEDLPDGVVDDDDDDEDEDDAGGSDPLGALADGVEAGEADEDDDDEDSDDEDLIDDEAEETDADDSDELDDEDINFDDVDGADDSDSDEEAPPREASRRAGKLK